MPVTTSFISFPEGVVQVRPLRLALLANTEAWFALEKPPGLTATRDALRSDAKGTTLLDALRREAALGKGQFSARGISEVHAVSFPDPEVAGIFLCAKSEAAKMSMKNAMGACEFTFFHRFLTFSRENRGEFLCELPLAHPAKSARMLVSNTTGKRTATRFRIFKCLRGYALWEAESAYNRRHQIRLHAAESGIPVLGDRFYAGSNPLYLSQLKPKYRAKGPEKPLYEHPALYMTKMRLPDPASGEQVEIEAPTPPKAQALIARIERYG